ncbi:VWA domain-containing protein [Desulfuromonas sp. TF]|uniref:vWA domain-containing protein n=1 Tax=Desulfuromonas sp. TF TaxID=1232410 RepID=UPI000429E6BB|nr:VWA domain-containing protein [Desulfuromonas sp. TF]
MLVDFFMQLRQAKVPVTIREYLSLMEAMDKQVAWGRVEDFYYLARLCLVKDESHFDKFDRVFAHYFKGVTEIDEELKAHIPEEWLRRLSELVLTEEEKNQIEALGGFEKLMETLKKRLAEQKERHQGGSKWIGTGGRSPFGAYGYNPEGVRIGQDRSRHRRAVKVWDRREFKNLDGSVELGTRNIKVALRRLRHFAREGAPDVLDLPGTIRSTARNAGYLDLKMVPQLHNKIKVLLFLDVGGSMDDHIKICEELFSAARSEFKYLEHFYFHNFVYESLWRDNQRFRAVRNDLWDVIHTYGPDYKLIFVGDASMSPYEITEMGGSVEHYNKEAGYVWGQRLLEAYKHAVWFNPVPQELWPYTQSIGMVRQIMGGRMFPLTLEGLDEGIRLLSK